MTDAIHQKTQAQQENMINDHDSEKNGDSGSDEKSETLKLRYEPMGKKK